MSHLLKKSKRVILYGIHYESMLRRFVAKNQFRFRVSIELEISNIDQILCVFILNVPISDARRLLVLFASPGLTERQLNVIKITV